MVGPGTVPSYPQTLDKRKSRWNWCLESRIETTRRLFSPLRSCGWEWVKGLRKEQAVAKVPDSEIGLTSLEGFPLTSAISIAAGVGFSFCRNFRFHPFHRLSRGLACLFELQVFFAANCKSLHHNEASTLRFEF